MSVLQLDSSMKMSGQLADVSIPDPVKISTDDVLKPVLEQFTTMKRDLINEIKDQTTFAEMSRTANSFAQLAEQTIQNTSKIPTDDVLQQFMAMKRELIDEIKNEILQQVTACLAVTGNESTPAIDLCTTEDGFVGGDWQPVYGAGWCGLAESGVVCKINEEFMQKKHWNPYAGKHMEGVPLKFISNTVNFNMCGIRKSDDNLDCQTVYRANWAQQGGIRNPPTGPMKWVGLGYTYSIAVDMEGKIHVFGLDANQFDKTKHTPKVKQVFMGEYYFCAIKEEDDEVFCDAARSQSAHTHYPGDPPAELSQGKGWVSLALSGDGYACGIRKVDSTIQCWPDVTGKDDQKCENGRRSFFGCHDGPDLRGEKALSFGGGIRANMAYGLCAIAEDHTLKCVSSGQDQKESAEKFMERAESLGKVKDVKFDQFPCAVKMDGTHVCFTPKRHVDYDPYVLDIPDYAGSC